LNILFYDKKHMKDIMSEGAVDEDKTIIYDFFPSPFAKSTLLYLQSVGYHYCNDIYYYKTGKSNPKSYLIIYTVSGKGALNYRGKQYDLLPNQILLIDFNDEQEYFCPKNCNWEYKFFRFYGCVSKGYFDNINKYLGPVFSVPNNRSISQLIDDLYGIVEKHDLQYEIKAANIINQIFTELFLFANKMENSIIRIISSKQISHILDIIKDNYSAKLLIKDIAESQYIGINQLIKDFKAVTGYTPYVYLTNYRITISKEMLINTDFTIDEISRNVGFENAGNFIKAFLKIEGITPAKYRKCS
jgi:AraC-like DNA-binding protein